MSEEEFSPIRPKSVPLSHVEPPSTERRLSKSPLPWRHLLLGGVAISILVLVFLVVPDLVKPVVTSSPAATAIPDADSPTPTSVEPDEQLPPFEALLREQTREKAQAELSRFVELQIQLEQTMQVGQWGQAGFDEAKSLATRGDGEFVAQAYDASLASYRAAGDALEALITTGESLLSEALQLGAEGLAELDQNQALAGYQRALTIDPENSAAKLGVTRANLLPQVIDLMREAKNQELAGDFRAAQSTYEKVQALDPQTQGLAAALTVARSGVADMVFRQHLSDGFKAMDAEQFEAARSAFNKALALRSNDPVALGGLEQVAERKDLATISALRDSAAGFESAEDWRRAIEDYDQVLALDGNIQFAKSGRARAVEQERTSITLGNIIASPDKLSSKSLYGQAKDILQAAQRLEPRGQKLAAQLARVEDLLATYGTPVAVTFRSDNRTEVTLSTIGRLGTFAEKQLSLRPGAYTVIGSRDGCRDIRESILVRPEMQPVEIRCEETF